MSSETPTISITIHEARNLPQNKGKLLGFYVRCKNNFNGKIFQTSTKEGTNTPSWNETFEINESKKIKNEKELYFHVWMNSFFKESIGTLKIQISKNKFEDKWYMLELDKKWIKEINKAEIRISINQLKFKEEEIKKEEIKEEKDSLINSKDNENLNFEEFKSKYNIIGTSELGEGAFSIVVAGEIIKTKERVAIKKITKKDIPEDQLEMIKREIQLMRQLHHKNIVKLFDVYENNEILYLILEYVEGGELYDRLVQGALNERQAACVLYQLVSAITYLHKNNIAHRDLKPENILCVYKNKLYIKIADFGLSKDFSTSLLQTCCGTPSYVAPEIIKGDCYTCQCDIWSIGVITYLVLSGNLPFYDENEEVIFDKILDGHYDFSSSIWQTISVKAKDFIMKCLNENPNERPTSFDLLKHSWLSNAQVRLDTEEEMGDENNKFMFEQACGYVSKQGKTMG
ncbi:protein kinase, putative [Entamoeba histolytica HM-1:IMSS-B]|uniref:Protein kinase, putative n=6 Tax=Entamoeba histolytica TaxID=5759 RepID=A0A8U0WQ30_ENTH1|nr:protein kinase, putative [Entamoeba histolytica HM-1:IMSS]EMD43485.1 myosin light chain kinase, putative [Entamoeba histolytica KU27]EMH77309.1 protein kinase, putative [Entamoeba histolytica HM-1:IMSS-B]EMS17541.1 myosin light chain kinase, putative [Entamoeba histolytica HM-3:IMSS]ENY61013.1 myosin light chain kinase, putative [Entamoeba histolytica HM-1:IMSS-A]BAC82419.1 hypothetical protein [Entamoeba histolytica]|eukprot:XP_650428.1 protein kinase, putative [Entamoeba histolytica HM-1:IMSS]